MTDIDHQIDLLYQLPPAEFTAARTALAKRLTGEQGRLVARLKKPSGTPWAVNQLYWKARPLYDRVIERGQAVRAAEIATLKGRKADVPQAAEVHRRAIAEAVHRTMRLASDAGLNADSEQVGRMLEALSLLPTPSSEPPGRFTKVAEPPAGFAALAGITPVKRVADIPPSARSGATAKESKQQSSRARRANEIALRTATRAFDRAREREHAARRSLERAEADAQAAEQAVVKARQRLS